MIWADATALVVAVLISGALFFLSLLSGGNPLVFIVYWIVLSKTTIPLWIVLRMVDLLLTGRLRLMSDRRRGIVKAQIVP